LEVAGDPGAVLQADLRAIGEESTRRAAVSAVRVRRFVYAATALYALLFAAFSLLHYFAYGYGRFDLGNMVQAIWSTAHGRFLETTSVTGTQMSRLGAHADPFLALLAPIWRVWPSPLALLLLQAIAVAAGALPVFWLARKHLASEQAGALFAVAYLIFPATQFNAFTPAAGFHSVSLALPLILFAIWFLDEGRWIPFGVCALVAASTKEEIPAAIGCLGIWYAVRHRKRLVGLAIFALGVAAALVNFLVIIPHYAPPGVQPFADRYAEVGGTPTGIVHKAVTDPMVLLQAVATGHKAVYLALLLVPFLGLWLREPLLFLGAVPDLVINLLSSKPEQTTLQFQYTAGIVPFLVVASIFGLKTLKRDPVRVSFWVLAGATCLALYSPIYLSAGDVARASGSSAVQSAKQQALAMIPESAPVAASNELAGRLSARRFIYVFPYVHGAHWVVLDRNDVTMGEPQAYRRAIAHFEARPGWRVVSASHGISVLHQVTEARP
jgi:uncharacterized membrane protein